MSVLIFYIVILLAFAGFLAGSESALSTISRVMVESLEKKSGGNG